MENRDLDELQRQVNALPRGLQAAFAWVLENKDALAEMIVEGAIPPEEFDFYLDWALQRQEYLSCAILLYQRALESRGKEDKN